MEKEFTSLGIHPETKEKLEKVRDSKESWNDLMERILGICEKCGLDERKEPFLVNKIEKGIVIDHIPAGEKVFEILEYLRERSEISPSETYISLCNVESNKLGRKSILKIPGVDSKLSEEDLEEIRKKAPRATINYIRDFEVEEKIAVTEEERLRYKLEGLKEEHKKISREISELEERLEKQS